MPPNVGAMDDTQLKRAREEAGRYNWLAAVETYKEVLGQSDSSPNPETLIWITGLLAKCHFKSAFQSKSREEFRQRMQLAQASYDTMTSLYEKVGSEGLAKMAKTKGLFAEFWLREDSENRRTLVERCIALSQEAICILEKQGDGTRLAEAHSTLLSYYLESLHLLTDGESLAQRFTEALNLGRTTVSEWEASDGGEELAEVLHSVLWILTVLAQVLLQPAEFENLVEQTNALEAKLSRLFQRLGTPYLECVSKEIAGDIAFDRKGDPRMALSLYEESLSKARDIGDSLTIGRLLAFMGLAELWHGYGEEYSDYRRDALENGVKLGEEAAKVLEIPFHTSYLAAACDAVANCHIDLATLVETEREKKRPRLDSARAVSRRALAYETHTWGWQRVAHSLSKALYFLATLETDTNRKRELLEETLRIRAETVRVMDSLAPNTWSAGVMRNYLALIRAEVARLETNPGAKGALLRGAVSDMTQCMEMCSKWSTFPGSFAYHLGTYAEGYGDVLSQLYWLTTDPDTAHTGIDQYKEAIGYFEKSGATILVAELNWKIGMMYDALADFSAASDAFGNAAQNYKLGAHNIPKISSSFEELGNYMDAWSIIERARLQHSSEEYSEAEEQYAIAAKKLQTTGKWEYLSELCLARSLAEKGEDLSQREKHEASIESFKKSLEKFRASRAKLERKLKECTEDWEKNELAQWIRITSQREEFSLGRVEVEEAKILDKQGQKTASSRKYQSAAKNFRGMATRIEGSNERKELETFSQFCEAWARMKEAESRVAPEIYAEAAESFLKARQFAPQERLGLLALASASICRALESGTRFRLTRNAQLYPDIKMQLETAADYFQEAGFRKTASWTQGTERLFDALVYLSAGETEKDPKKKTELYLLAEKHSELAAKLYGEAGFPSKRREALQHLGRAREEKELLLESMEALSDIPVSSGSLVTSIVPGRGKPLGLERFEEANIVGHLTVPERDLKAGSDFTFEVEMANVGRTTATLIRVENVIPEGFEIQRERNPYRIEGNSIDMRGKRLEHLKMDEMRIVLRPARKGIFELRPRVVFADDRGNIHRFEFEPVEVVVEELGIAGWLKGPSKKEETKLGPVTTGEVSKTPLLSKVEGIQPIVHLPQEFQFETERAREVFEKLVKEFLHDYMSKRLYIDAAGWRSLMDLVEQTKIPRSSLYGPAGRDGPVLAELEHRGLIETRIFPKERGRGGDIKKIRVAYGNEVVRTIVDRTAMQNP